MKCKRAGAMLLSISMLFGLAACGSKKDSKPESTRPSKENQKKKDETDSTNAYNQRQLVTIDDEEHPGILSVMFEINAKKKFNVYAEMQESNVMIPGIFASPVMVYCYYEDYGYYEEDGYPEPDDVAVSINYDINYLYGIPEENLLLVSTTDYNAMSVVEDATFNYNRHQVTFKLEMPAIFFLVDAYQWYLAQGQEASQYAYDLPKEYENMSSWEKELDTGSILELADPEWAQANAPIFHVSTPEELASVVYYMNTLPPHTYTDYSTTPNVEVYLEQDLDLTGYEWMPMGWRSKKLGEIYEFGGLIDGQGYTINGLKIDGKNKDSGFVGYSTNLTMRNITFTDAEVWGSENVGICAGEVIDDSVWENVHVQGHMNCGSDYYGGLVGSASGLEFQNCSAEYKINGDQKILHELTYSEFFIREYKIHEIFILELRDDMTIINDVWKIMSQEKPPEVQNLVWHVDWNGEMYFERPCLAEFGNGLDTSAFTEEGLYEVYLVASDGKTFERVSNVIEITV